MKQLLLTTVLLLVLTSCSGRKQIEKAISYGNYDQAINNALQKLKNNKDKARKQDYVLMLEDAYYKVLDEDLATINRLKKDGNPELYNAIYKRYLDLEARQNAIKRVLPLQINGKQLNLKFNDYSSALVSYKYKTSEYLLTEGSNLLNTNQKANARKAHEFFSYIDRINPNYKNTRQLIPEAYQKGMEYVFVSIENSTNQIIPQNLQAELLDFNTYGLHQFWVTYLTNYDTVTDYDYALQLKFKQINISPEQVNEREVLREKQIVDGWEYLTDNNGNVVLDSLNTAIKVDKIIDVKARFIEVQQHKTSQVIADVVLTDLKQNQIIDTFTLDSGFTFENVFGRARGDRRALLKEDRELLEFQHVAFPSNEQMVYDTGEDLKQQLKSLIKSFNFNE